MTILKSRSVSYGLLATALTLLGGSVAAQQIEGFNSDGDGVRYTIEGRYLTAANNLWTTVPDTNTVPAITEFNTATDRGQMLLAPGATLVMQRNDGLPLLAGIETGGQLFDGTAASARRVAFHTESRTNGSLLNTAGLDLLDAAVGWAAPGASQNIVFVTNGWVGIALDLPPPRFRRSRGDCIPTPPVSCWAKRRPQHRDNSGVL